MRQPAYFYPRSPCGERPLTTCKYACKPEFLSTLSLRRATSPHRPAPASVRISIHALLAESDHQNMKYVEEVSISIHALLAESDPCAWYAPAGAHISIHALLAESDTDRMFCSRQRLNFYPRSPCGERPSAAAPIKLTRSISIHALLAESDPR